MANYAFGIRPIPDVENGHEFVGDNFTQLLPHTAILEGKTGLKFKNCNLTNCDIPADAICEGCQPRQRDFCTHIHNHITKFGHPECAVDCSHVVYTDTITIDGVVVDTVYHYSDSVVQ